MPAGVHEIAVRVDNATDNEMSLGIGVVSASDALKRDDAIEVGYMLYFDGMFYAKSRDVTTDFVDFGVAFGKGDTITVRLDANTIAFAINGETVAISMNEVPRDRGRLVLFGV